MPDDAGPIRVLIVDDSLVARTMMVRLLQGRANIRVVAAVGNDADALACAASSAIDVILLDLEMPGMGGAALLPRLVAASGGARVVLVSASAGDDAAARFAALAAGASDAIRKPDVTRFPGDFAERLAQRVEQIGRPVLARPARGKGHASRRPLAEPVACLAIGASTGGVHALRAILEALCPGFEAPILITQHLPCSFMQDFAREVAAISGWPTRIAEEGAPVERGGILIAPGNGHIRLVRSGRKTRVAIDRSPVESGHMPSVDPMFEAVAEHYGQSGIGVVLSGMGRDGATGAGCLVEAGGEIFVQDPESSVVWGMPGAIADAGYASAILTPEAIAGRILSRARGCPPVSTRALSRRVGRAPIMTGSRRGG